MSTKIDSDSKSSQLSDFAKELISLCLSANVLLFGEFTLKSGRISPYFYNAGLLYQGNHLQTLAESYASAISSSSIGPFDILFGPAYKGIALAAVTAVELNRSHGHNVGFAYNRKEAKDHGEGGTLVGAPLRGKRVVILDDVITAGTAIREAISLIESLGGKLVGIVESLDRQEKGKASELSAIQEIERETSVPVVSIMTMKDIIAFLRAKGGMEKQLEAMEFCKPLIDVIEINA